MQVTIDLRCKQSLGNCLFQYAACVDTAKKLGVTHYINKADWNHSDVVCCDLGILERGDTITLNGYFQDPLVSNCGMSLNPSMLSSRLQLDQLVDITTKNICLVHVRGGDFLAASSFVLSKEYYNAAKRKMLKLNKDLEFHVITDDIRHAKRVVKYAKSYSTNSARHDFILLAHAQYAIIANSTFSWWATKLNAGYLKFCIAPNSWLKEDDRLLATAPHINFSV